MGQYLCLPLVDESHETFGSLSRPSVVPHHCSHCFSVCGLPFTLRMAYFDESKCLHLMTFNLLMLHGQLFIQQYLTTKMEILYGST